MSFTNSLASCKDVYSFIHLQSLETYSLQIHKEDFDKKSKSFLDIFSYETIAMSCTLKIPSPGKIKIETCEEITHFPKY